MLALSSARRLALPLLLSRGPAATAGELLVLQLSGPGRRPFSSQSGQRGDDDDEAGDNPVVYMDVGADNQPLGRVVLEVSRRCRLPGGSPRCPWRPGRLALAVERAPAGLLLL